MSKNPQILRFTLLLCTIAVVSGVISAQAPNHRRIPMTTDWSTRHVIFSTPRTAEQAQRVQSDPRYKQQWIRRNLHTAAALPSLHGLGGWRPVLGHGGKGRRVPAFRRDWSEDIGSGASMETNMFPAKFAFDATTPDCTNDYVAFTTHLIGGEPDVADIVAFNNLYTGPLGFCGTGEPTTLFAYHTQSNGGNTSTSPVLSGGVSGDGSQIAFMEGGGGVGVLHILRWAAGEGTPGTTGAAQPPDVVTALPAVYTLCTSLPVGSCLLNLTFANGADDSLSSPYVNYDTDTLYVGDDLGNLHKFTGVFEGTPAEVTTGGWPVAVHAGAQLNSPIYELHANNIYVTDSLGVLSFVLETDSSVGACAIGAPPCLGSVTVNVTNGNGPIDDAPIVDSTNETVFTFAHADASGVSASVTQVTTALANPVTATVGRSFTNPLYSGDFDNNYYNNPDPSTGFLYVCGNDFSTTDPGNPQSAAIFRIGFTSGGTMMPNNDGNVLDLSSAQDTAFGRGRTICSPGTENDDGTTDLIFFSVHKGGLFTGCGGNGCVMSFDITSGFPTTAANATTEAGGTSGIIIDNISTTSSGPLPLPQTSNIYFTTLTDQACSSGTTASCAVKLTQSGLN